MTIDQPIHRSWISAINTTAAREHISLPQVTDYGMGSLLWRDDGSDRLVSFTRRLVPLSEAESNGVEWSFWSSADSMPACEASFRDALYPTEAKVNAVLSLMKGWLLDKWTAEDARKVVLQSSTQPITPLSPVRKDDSEFWLSDDRAVGFIVFADRCRIRTGTTSLATWQSRTDEKTADSLSLSRFDRFVVWLAEHWSEIAHGVDHRPHVLEHRGVAASRIYDNVKLDPSATSQQDVAEWWSRHAMRAADGDLPNIFFERQADELVISWDATPSDNRFYRIYSGEQAVPAAVAVPVLRRLVNSRLSAMQLTDDKRSRLLDRVSSDSATGYATLFSLNSTITAEWLTKQGFSEGQAQQVALSGTCRHPVVGLLRSSYGTSITAVDYEVALGMLQPSEDDSYDGLRSLAKGMNSHVDIREPWESGYRLASLIRKKLSQSIQDKIDMEHLVSNMGIDVRNAEFSDSMIRGVCIGAPAYKPLIIINDSCSDATGVSGRRITLAHELCHLLFDRSRLRNLARFDWDSAENDRLLEMRANAFAVELLAPMELLIDPAGKVLDDDELAPIAIKREVSTRALYWHARNLRNRIAML